VLSVHAEADRPLGFDQVVELSGNRVKRAQVSAASAALCRSGQLNRIRSGPPTSPQHGGFPLPAGPTSSRPGSRPHGPGACPRPAVPAGVQMTAELLADLEWARLTGKLAAHGSTAPQRGVSSAR
jgi:hypothetical protein